MQPGPLLEGDAATVPNVPNLPAYVETRDSGVEWLGDVPEHWEVRRIKDWLSVNQTVLPEDTDPDYEFRYIDIGTVQTGILVAEPKRMRFGASPSRARRALRSGDTIVSTVRTYLKAVWHVPTGGTDLVASTGFAVLTPQAGTEPAFVGHLCRSQPFTDCVTAQSVGVAYPAIAETRFATIPVAIPPLAEQTAIVRFLDYVDRRIRRYIRAKEKLIALLEEQKQAAIQRAVSGQVDVRTGRPYPAYRDSGLNWLGNVPKHWNIVPLRRVALDRCDGPFGSGLKSSHYTKDGVRVVRLQNIGHGEFRNSDTAFISHRYYSSLGDHTVLARDLLISGLGDGNHPAGRACVAPDDLGPAMVKADCFRFRLDENSVEPKFAALQLTATAAATSAVLSTGATRQRINLRSTSARPIALPPPDEQRDVVKHIDLHVAGVRRGQDIVERQIGLLREFRTRLIADVVTGKLDVRGVGAALVAADPQRADFGHLAGAGEHPNLPPVSSEPSRGTTGPDGA